MLHELTFSNLITRFEVLPLNIQNQIFFQILTSEYQNIIFFRKTSFAKLFCLI